MLHVPLDACAMTSPPFSSFPPLPDNSHASQPVLTFSNLMSFTPAICSTLPIQIPIPIPKRLIQIWLFLCAIQPRQTPTDHSYIHLQYNPLLSSYIPSYNLTVIIYNWVIQ